MSTISITHEQDCDNKTCPVCQSKNISLEPSGCLCHITNHSCWDHPVCEDCGYTAGAGAGNSTGGKWIEFAVPYAELYEITYTKKENDHG